MNLSSWCLPFVLMITGCGLAFAQSPSPADLVIQIPFQEAELTLDGILDEPVWAKIPPLPAMKENQSGNPARDQTTIKLWYDNDALYLGWECLDRDIQATYTKHDSQLWDEEVVEFFIAPVSTISAPGVLDYYELQWNPLGTMFDAIIHNTLKADGLSKSMKGDWDWTAKGMRCAVRVDGTVGQAGDKDTSWHVEVLLPFSALEQSTPKAGTIWRGNLYRYSRDTGLEIEYQALQATRTPSFHQPKSFVSFVFGPQE